MIECHFNNIKLEDEQKLIRLTLNRLSHLLHLKYVITLDYSPSNDLGAHFEEASDHSYPAAQWTHPVGSLEVIFEHSI